MKKFLNKRILTWAALTVGILVLCYMYIGGDYGLWQHYQREQKKEQLSQELIQLRQEQDSLRVLIKRLESDSSFIAKTAREKYNMGRSDEEIIRVIHEELQ